MEIEEYLKSLGMNDEEIETVKRKYNKVNTKHAEENVNKLKNLFSIENEEIKRLLLFFPTLLSCDVDSDSQTSIKSKSAFYKNLFKVSDKSLVKYFLAMPGLLSYDTNSDGPTSIKSKLKFYGKTLKMNETETAKFVKKLPSLLGFDIISDSPTSIKSKIGYLKNLLNLSDEDVAVVIKKLPQLLSYDTTSNDNTSILGKYNYYKKKLELSDEQTRFFIKQLPALLSYDVGDDTDEKEYAKQNPKSVPAKLKYYKETLNMSDDQLRRFVTTCPNVLGYDIISNEPSSAAQKIKNLREIATDEQIIRYPRSMCLPAQKIKFRYMLLYEVCPNSLETGNLMIREQKLWARKCFLHDIGQPIIWSNFLANEPDFIKAFGITSEELMANPNYQITPEVIDLVEKEFQLQTGRDLKLSETEIQEICKN